MRTRYRFSRQAGGRYYWHSVLPISPGDSRHEQVSCPVRWFWSMMTLSFWKVPFSAQEVLDLVQECDSLQEFEQRFCEAAEERSRS
jgi:hypothetical protein